MTTYLFPGVIGLFAGLVLHWAGFSRTDGLRRALGLRRSLTLRSGLTALGWGLMLTALLCWLAVIDVDTIEVLPLSLGSLLGGGLLGIAAGLCGFTPTTAFAGLGAGHFPLEALSVLAGCFAGAWLLPSLESAFLPLHTAAPYAAATLFRVTLDEPFLLDGAFLGQGCAGALLAVIAMCIPSPRPVILPEALPAEAPPPPADPEHAPEETFVALLEGEEPLVVDTDEPAEAPVPPDDDQEE